MKLARRGAWTADSPHRLHTYIGRLHTYIGIGVPLLHQQHLFMLLSAPACPPAVTALWAREAFDSALHGIKHECQRSIYYRAPSHKTRLEQQQHQAVSVRLLQALPRLAQLWWHRAQVCRCRVMTPEQAVLQSLAFTLHSELLAGLQWGAWSMSCLAQIARV